MSCAYCYVPRRNGFANPITVFANIEQLLWVTERHIARQGRKATVNQCDPVDRVYDIGELDAGTGPAAKAQMAAEVIFLTHNDRLHEVNLGWHPRAEELLWTPGTQDPSGP